MKKTNKEKRKAMKKRVAKDIATKTQGKPKFLARVIKLQTMNAIEKSKHRLKK